MNTIVEAAAVQISPELYSGQDTVEKIVNNIRELAGQDVQFATFPYYPYFSFLLPRSRGRSINVCNLERMLDHQCTCLLVGSVHKQ